MFSHLQETFKRLILHYPEESLEKLEEVSYLLKHQGPGGLKIESLEQMNKRKPGESLRRAIERMMPRNTFRTERLTLALAALLP